MSETEATVGRNEPCPCGSGKKYKRCHGVSAAPKLSAPSIPQIPEGALPPEMANMDPAMMMQLGQALQRLPRGQMQRLQSLMQRAMAGQDVSAEAEAFEKMLPPEFKEMVKGLQPPAGAEAEAEAPAEMSPEDARRIIEEGVASGKLSREQADELLGGAAAAPADSEPVASEPESKGGLSRFWRRGK